MKPVFPYPTLFGDLALDVVSVTVDGAELPFTKISRAERTVALHQTGRADWDTASLRLKAFLPEAEFVDGPWSDIVCLAVLTEKATNARTTARLTREADGSWSGAVDLDHSRHLTRANLSLNISATVDGIDGRLIGQTTETWFIDLKAMVPVRQRELEIVQIDFLQGPHEWLRPFKDSAWIVDTTSEIPTVYLNTRAVEGLVDLLNRTGGTPVEKVLRDITASQIAQDAWTAMFHAAVADLDVDEDGTPRMPAGWRGRVLQMMLPDVMPGYPPHDALYEISERRAKGFGWSELQTSVQYAAGKRSQAVKKLTVAVRSVVRTEEGQGR
ncbi:hypothetical protein [Kribbella sp. NPDC049227]|uniref:hypothetical protein n=1 Tax=Kribbella sp. NPDC049227 TaxID=3364113 RepID=UPI00371A9DE2